MPRSWGLSKMGISDRVIAIVRDIVADHMDKESREITLDSCLIDDLGFDFADEMTFMCNAEAAFKIELPDAPLRNDTTIADLIRLVEEAVIYRLRTRL